MNNNITDLEENLKFIEIRKQNIIDDYEINIKEIKNNKIICDENLFENINKLKKENYKLNDKIIKLEETNKKIKVKKQNTTDE